MVPFKSLRILPFKFVRCAFLMLFTSQFIVEMFQYQVSATNSGISQNKSSKQEFQALSLNGYKSLVNAQNNCNLTEVRISGFENLTNALQILGLFIENNELRDIKPIPDSLPKNGVSDTSINYPVTTNSDYAANSIRPSGKKILAAKTAFCNLESYNLTLYFPEDRIFVIAGMNLSKDGVFHAMKFLFQKFSAESQQVILKELKSESFEDYVDILSTNRGEQIVQEVEFVGRMLSSLFVETILRDCIGSLPEMITKITMSINFNSAIYMSVDKYLARFKDLKEVTLEGSYFENADIHLIQFLSTLKNCKAISFGNGKLTNLFLHYLEIYAEDSAKETPPNTKSICFQSLRDIGFKFSEHTFDFNRFRFLKKISPNSKFTFSILSPVDEELKEKIRQNLKPYAAIIHFRTE